MALTKDTLFLYIIAGIVFIMMFMSYIYPKSIDLLFNTSVGNILLLISVIGVASLNYKWAIGLASILIILNQSFRKSRVEGFNTIEWPKELIAEFLSIQKTKHPQFVFDIDIIQKQATPIEAKTFLENGKWSWSVETQEMFKEAMSQSFTMKSNLATSLDDAQTIYNETAMKELLSWNTKEGLFLLSGAVIGQSDGLPANTNNLIRCGKDGNMEKVVYTGYDSINASLQSTITQVSNEQIPKEVAGFQFIKGACNPCVALQDTPDYSCAFSLNTGSGPTVSSIWNDLWGLTGDEYNDNISNDEKQFPILNQLKNELNSAAYITRNPTNNNNNKGDSITQLTTSNEFKYGSGSGSGSNSGPINNSSSDSDSGSGSGSGSNYNADANAGSGSTNDDSGPGSDYEVGTASQCSARKDCKTCLTGYTSTGTCYWCKNKGCVNPDDYYDADMCSSDPQGCDGSK